MKPTLKEELEIPQGISISIDGGIFTVKGPKGEVKKELYNPKINAKVMNNLVMFEAQKATQREKKLIHSYLAHLENMIDGVSHGHSFKLRICSSHFPMNVSVKGNVFEIKNFVGETIPRTITILQGVNVKVDGQFLLIESVDKEAAGRTASLIERLTRRSAFDKRIFQDGIFIIEKNGKPIIK
jgi:large subunit ribosomal protein L6